MRNADTPALDHYSRVIPTKRPGTCHTCGKPTSPGRDWAAVNASGKWLAYCHGCAVSYGSQVAGLIALAEAAAQVAPPEAIAALALPSEAIIATVMNGTAADHEAFSTVLALTDAVATLTTAAANAASASDPLIVALTAIAGDPSASPRDRGFAQSLLAWSGPLTERQREAAERMVAKSASGGSWADVQRAAADLPDGWYAVPAVAGDNDLSFLRVATNKGFYDPSRKGQRYVRQVLGGGTEVKPRLDWVLAALTAVATAGPEASAALFGQKIGRCGWCGKDLTRKYSRGMGYGPDCADHHGLPFDHAAYAAQQDVTA